MEALGGGEANYCTAFAIRIMKHVIRENLNTAMNLFNPMIVQDTGIDGPTN